MKRVWIHLLSVCLLPLLAGGGIYTNAFFFDGERSDGNTLESSYLDAVLAGGPISGPICAAGGGSGTELLFSNAGAFAFHYDVGVENATGTGCTSAALEVYRNDTLVFDGPLADLAVEDNELEKDADDLWRVKVKFPLLDAVGSCQFETVFSAGQEMFASGEAFYDRESLTHSVDVGDDAFCGPRVNLHLSKAISGDPHGYEFSDFSYRVTGDGIDAIVPHDGIVRLPTGIYGIEELVPEGFVKDDWRIGWYGECEAGSTFTTSITIDEGNVDHGTLYCQADNQYRPGDDNSGGEDDEETEETETLVESEEETSSSRTTRDERRPRREPARGIETGDVEGEATSTETSILVSKENLKSDEPKAEEEPAEEEAGAKENDDGTNETTEPAGEEKSTEETSAESGLKEDEESGEEEGDEPAEEPAGETQEQGDETVQTAPESAE